MVLEHFGACLDALDRQTIRCQAEIIVVDDGSSDQTVEVAREFSVELISLGQNRGTSAARNAGILASRAPIVAFTDDDCIPNQDWLAELIRPYERDEVAGVGGLVSIARVETYVHRYLAANNPLAPLELNLASSDSLAYRLMLYFGRMWAFEDDQSGRAIYSCPAANMSFRRDVLDAVGLMDPKFTFGSDDEQVCARVREKFPNMVLWFEPRAKVKHDYVGTFRDVLRRNFAYGQGNGRSYLSDSQRRWPTVFPIPIMFLLGVAALRRPRHVVMLLGITQLALPHGVRGVWSQRRITNFAFSYVRLFEEGSHNAGLVVALLQGLFGEEP